MVGIKKLPSAIKPKFNVRGAVLQCILVPYSLLVKRLNPEIK